MTQSVRPPGREYLRQIPFPKSSGRLEEAAGAYKDLERLDTVWMGGWPSDLIARSELCSLAAERGDAAELEVQALTFYRDLATGKWLLDKPRYLFYSDRCRIWCRQTPVTADEFDRLRTTEERKLALTRAAEDLLNEPGRVITAEGKTHLAFWDTDPFAAVVLSTGFLEAHWWPQVLSSLGEDLEAALSTPNGPGVFGSRPAETPPFAVTYDFRIEDTAWLLQVWPGRPEAIYADIRQKQTLSLAMLGFVAMLLVFGSYITVRIVRRELEIAAGGMAVEATIPDGLPPISADKEALGSAVRNLLDNAVKYSPGTKVVWLDAEAAGGVVKISVRDRGVGISEEDRKRIFDRFYRADGEISKRVKGAGLGLSLVKHIVTAHGGTVECESRTGEGSAFTIRLPAAPVAGGE